MSTDLSPILTVARDILRTAPGKALHLDSIAEEAVATNKNMGLSASAFSTKLQAALAANLKLKTQKPTFTRVAGKKAGSAKKGWYRLKQQKTYAAIAKVAPPLVTPDFIGRAGEFAAMGELLFWGYNVSMMAVDNGVDLVVEKHNVHFDIQVKTATESSAGRHLFTVKRPVFLAKDRSSMFYVLVVRKKNTTEFLVIPSNYLRTLLEAGAIGGGPVLSMCVTIDSKGHQYTLNSGTNINIFVGNFGVIR